MTTDPWAQYEVSSAEPEEPSAGTQQTALDPSLRIGGGLLARALEGAYGGLGTLFELPSIGANLLYRGATGEEPPPSPQELAGLKNPLSAEVARMGTRALTGEALEPQGKLEELGQETAEDIGSFLSPGLGKVKPLRAIGLAVAGNAVKGGSELFGADKSTAEKAKLGTMVLGSFIHPRAAKNLNNKLWSTVRNSIPKGTLVPADGFKHALDELEQFLVKQGLSTAEKRAAASIIAELRAKAAGGTIDLHDLLVSRQDLNKSLRELFRKEGAVFKPKKNKYFHTQIRNAIDDTIDLYGQHHPEWKKAFDQAREVHSAIASSDQAAHWMLDTAKSVPALKHTAAYIAGGLALGTVPKAAGVVAAASPLYLGAKIGVRAFKSPTLAKHYVNTITSALRQDSKAYLQNLKKLDKELRKENIDISTFPGEEETSRETDWSQFEVK